MDEMKLSSSSSNKTERVDENRRAVDYFNLGSENESQMDEDDENGWGTNITKANIKEEAPKDPPKLSSPREISWTSPQKEASVQIKKTQCPVCSGDHNKFMCLNSRMQLRDQQNHPMVQCMNCSQMGHLKCEVEETNMDKRSYEFD